jgi:alkanesulfonate monooxygenase SsuD/methylene tetrahydromethanopterin reductase-like flavin-dependent oxidoreductase (luciferase family)
MGGFRALRGQSVLAIVTVQVPCPKSLRRIDWHGVCYSPCRLVAALIGPRQSEGKTVPKQFHLAWFVSRGFSPKAWRFEWAGDTTENWLKPDLFVDLARCLERAYFDYVIIEDSSHVPRTFGNSHDIYLKYAVATPKMDPAVLVPYMAQATKHLGIVPTLSTAEYHPYMLARLVNTLDHVTDGRVGWNMVTGSSDHAAQNYGHDRQFPHDERYDRADEFTEIVTRLWEYTLPQTSRATSTHSRSFAHC